MTMRMSMPVAENRKDAILRLAGCFVDQALTKEGVTLRIFTDSDGDTFRFTIEAHKDKRVSSS